MSTIIFSQRVELGDLADTEIDIEVDHIDGKVAMSVASQSSLTGAIRFPSREAALKVAAALNEAAKVAR